MAKQGEATRAWLERYFGIKISMFRPIPKSLLQRIRSISTLVIDTDCITDGTLHFDRTVGYDDHSSQDTVDAALHALVGNTSTLATTLRQALPNHNTPYDPVAHHDATYLSSTWHHGERYQTYWIGEPAQLLSAIDLTDNEREKLVVSTRKASLSGETVYLVGKSLSATPPSSLRSAKIELVGALHLRPRVFSGIEAAFAQCRERGIQIVYASSDSEHLVRTLADVTCLVSRATLPYVPSTKSSSLSTTRPVYAELSAAQQKRLLDSIASDDTLVVREAFPKFWKEFVRFL